MIRPQYPLESLFGRVLSPLEQFLRRTTAGGIVLMATTVVTLGLAALLGEDALHHFWAGKFTVVSVNFLDLTRHQVVNDGLMALFFLVVGLELKREVLVGELSSLKDAALPVVGAIGGMVVPAAIYAALNRSAPQAAGWGIPMATDIAFAIGILVLLGWRVPRNLIIFLMALAIADDLGAVLVIAIFYTDRIDWQYLFVAASLLGVLALLNRGGIRHSIPYALAGVALWYALHGSGLHATLAGVLLAIAIPARSSFAPAEFERHIDALRDRLRTDRQDPATADDPLGNSEMGDVAGAMERSARAVQSPLQRIEHAITPWVTFLVIPLFALANAGIDLTAIDWRTAFTHTVTLGALLGLVLGKFTGITLFSWVAVRLGIARLPAGVEWRHLMGASWLAGIGFTMSLFIAQLAFRDAALVEQAKLGILAGSAISAAIGLAWLYRAASPR